MTPAKPDRRRSLLGRSPRQTKKQPPVAPPPREKGDDKPAAPPEMDRACR